MGIYFIMPGSSKDVPHSIQSNRISPTRKFAIAQREPWSVPDEAIELPGPTQAPTQPPAINLLTTILPPVLMAAAMAVTVITGNAKPITIIPMLVMALGFPLANLIGLKSQKKKYQQSVIDRENNYKATLMKEHQKLSALLNEQSITLEREYPALQGLATIALNHTKRLWWRRPTDNDFLSLRMGTGVGPASFKVAPPRVLDNNDPVNHYCYELIDKFSSNPSIPLLLSFSEIGSVAIAAKTSSLVLDFSRRLLLDAIVHHSPADLNIAVLANNRDAEQNWGWLKWSPHTASLTSEQPRRLNFEDDQVVIFLKWLFEEYNARLKLDYDFALTTKRKQSKDYLIILEDNGLASQTPEISRIAENGYEVGLHLMFVGGRNWPRECRSRIDVSNGHTFSFIETWDAAGKTVHLNGEYEPVSIEQCEKNARSLASLEVIGSQANAQLPDSVRLSSVLGMQNLEVESIKQSWSTQFQPENLLQFPIGLSANRDQLEEIEINLLPESSGGVDAYHTILIGTTGSGKSEFMKSLVMAAALRYPPNLLNFFFMDFKGGAAFNLFEDLPHVSGIVTNLRPELVERGLDSIRNEIDRRQNKFALDQVQNIWGYNQNHPDIQMPHLILLLDEFARGLSDFPRLRETLDLLVRQGRSLGMYLILANQDTNSEVDRLLNNVGWRIALKVGKDEEIAMIDRLLIKEPSKLPRRAGEGYLRSIKGTIVHFQAGYAGLGVVDSSAIDAEGFTIYSVEGNGSLTKFYRSQGIATDNRTNKITHKITEESLIIQNLIQAKDELQIKPVPRIYLEPLPENINLMDVINESASQVAFSQGAWTSDRPEDNPIIAAVGYYDSPSDCLQDVLKIDFSQQDGHLWIIGAPGSDKETVLASMVLSLSLTHTPEEIHFFILDFGSGSLRSLDSLPHVASVIRLQDKERIQRLLSYLDAEMDARSSRETILDVSTKKRSNLFVIVNNYAEMRNNFPDEADHLSRYIRDGKSAGIHCIISTNRGAELNRNIASNITRKLVLQLASKDEYLDVIGRHVAPFSARSTGRGYWVDERPYECQTANPNLIDIKKLGLEMSSAWSGNRPSPIGIIPSRITSSELELLLQDRIKISNTEFPLGIAYESLEIIHPDLDKEMPNWLVLGPRESGKSNFLANVANSLLQKEENCWEVYALAVQRSPLNQIQKMNAHFHTAKNSADALSMLQNLNDSLDKTSEQSNTKYMVLLDDLSSLFDVGYQEVMDKINLLGSRVAARGDLHFMAAGLLDELRSQIGLPIIRMLRQSRTGMVFSKDTSELDWLGVQVLPMEYRKLEIPTGRGFYISKGRWTLVHTPLVPTEKK